MKAIFRFLDKEENFRFVFLANMFLGSLCIIGSFFYIAAGILMIWAAGLFISHFIIKGKLLLFRNRRLILLFLGSALFSCILHLKSNFFINIYYLLWMSICFFFFFGVCTGKGKSACKREAEHILSFVLHAGTIIMSAGLILLSVCPEGFDYGGYSFAIHENRFVGIINNANTTAFYALTSIISMNILWAIKKGDNTLSLTHKLYYTLSFIINILALFLSDSNDSLLMLIVFYCFMFLYGIFRGFRPGLFSILFRLMALMLACVVTAMSLIGTRTLVQEGISHMLSSPESSVQIDTGVTADNGKVILKPDTERKQDTTTFKHKNKNLDSGRFIIWKQALGLFERFPLFGIGKANVVDYGEKYLGGLRYFDFHNGLITITISYGLVGLNIFMVLAITIAKTLIKTLFRRRNQNRQDGRVLTVITSFCAGYCVYSLFEIALLADISYKVLIFWLILGIGYGYACAYEKNSLTRHEDISPHDLSLYKTAQILAKRK